MALDLRFKEPLGNSLQQLWRWAQDTTRELRKGIPEGFITASEIATGAVGSDEIADDAVGPSELAPIAAFRAHRNGSDQTGVANGVWTDVTFTAEAFDVGSHFASSLWTPPAGIVLVAGLVGITGTASTGNHMGTRIIKNGSVLAHALAMIRNAAGVPLSIVDLADGNDTYGLQGFYETSAGDATFIGDPTQTYLSGAWLGPNA